MSDQNILSAKNLKSAFIYLDADSAYTLKAPKGAILKIAKNSFEVKPGEKIQLEIKEAFSAGDIILAGLTTKSNGRLLQSGGMIYINATANDKAVKITKPINVSIPSPSYDENMQLFKGEAAEDGSINWVDPQPLDSSNFAKYLIKGELLFKANCASCHKITKVFTAPALAQSRERAPYRDWAYLFTRNPLAMTDPYAIALKQKYKPAVMTPFPQLTRADVNAILDYCDNEALLLPRGNSDKFPEPMNSDSVGPANTAIPSCFVSDTSYYPVPDTNIIVLPINAAGVDSIKDMDPNAMPQIPMYQFNIDQSGWYNVDRFINDQMIITTDVTLFTTLKMPKELDMQVYLCIPQRRLLASGNELENKEYQFYAADGIIPLILNDDAIIFAIGSDTANAYYGIVRFNVKLKQNIIVNVKASTREAILSAIKSNNLDGIKIEIEKPETYIRQLGVADSSNNNLKQEMQMQILERPCKTDTVYAEAMDIQVNK